MSNINPEEYREEMQAIYAATNKHRDVVSKATSKRSKAASKRSKKETRS